MSSRRGRDDVILGLAEARDRAHLFSSSTFAGFSSSRGGSNCGSGDGLGDHQKHVKCFGTFFDCDAGDEDLTAAQRTVNRVYPALSVIAFVVAVWNLVGTRAGVRKHVSCDFADFTKQ